MKLVDILILITDINIKSTEIMMHKFKNSGFQDFMISRFQECQMLRIHMIIDYQRISRIQDLGIRMPRR